MFIKILAVYFIVSGIFVLLKGKTLPLILKDFFEHPALIYLTGVILIFLGSGILIQNSILGGTWGLVTIFGFLVLLKGLAYLFTPNILARIALKKFKGGLSILGVISIIIGIYLLLIS